MMSGFYAFPSRPTSVGDSVSAAIEELNHAGEVELVPWCDLRVTGKVIISEILDAIDRSDFTCADITDANPNVLFELGYAIAKSKRVWLTVDKTYSDSNAKLESLRILTTIGYAKYENSRDIIRHFYQDRPYEDVSKTIFAQSIQPVLPAATHNFQILYLKSVNENEAAIRIARRLQDSRLPQIVDDPRESPIQALTWYAKQVYLSAGVICHLTDPQRERAMISNARAAFVAGMAHALGKRILMLIEGEYLAPIDYRDLAKHYTNSRTALTITDAWLAEIERDQAVLDSRRVEYFRTVALATQLKSLQLGEYVAENEIENLTEEYFVETAAYAEAVSGRHTVFVGRKGAGKTATFLKMSADLSGDKRNIVVSIRPIAYEMQGIIKLLTGIHDQAVKGFAIESLWKYLLMSELAVTVARELELRGKVSLSEDELDFLSFIDNPASNLRGSFVDRLERKVEQYSFATNTRSEISEDIHRGILHQLRQQLEKIISKRRRIAFLVDNLDLAWDVEASPVISQLILGLLGAARSASADLTSGVGRSQKMEVSLALFLRSDIFATVRRCAAEPDKVDGYKIVWADREVLGRVIDERLIKSQDEAVSPKEMWSRFFVSGIHGVTTREYILRTVLPRPRDLIFFVRSAVTHAINRAHTIVEHEDVLSAEVEYSFFAQDVMQVEGAGLLPNLQEVLLAFANCAPIIDGTTLTLLLKSAEIAENAESVVAGLLTLGFLGLEVRPSEFEFSSDFTVDPRSKALARKVEEQSGREQRFAIHPGFWRYLDARVDYADLGRNSVFMRK